MRKKDDNYSPEKLRGYHPETNKRCDQANCYKSVPKLWGPKTHPYICPKAADCPLVKINEHVKEICEHIIPHTKTNTQCELDNDGGCPKCIPYTPREDEKSLHVDGFVCYKCKTKTKTGEKK